VTASGSETKGLSASAWSPLRQPVFRSLWMAAVASNIGTWMHDVGAVWLMTSLTPSPIMVALMQTATSLPFFLLALPAGALADIVDRRRLLLLMQGWMLIAAALLGILTLIGAITPWLLLAFTFALGMGAAMTTPAWQAITPELVSREELPTAVALSGVGINLARAIGPALGGLIVAGAGSQAVFWLNAASFVGVMLVLYRWQHSPRQSALPAEHVLGAMRAGVRYIRHAPAVCAVLMRAGLFILCGSAVWALLPLVARRELGLDALGYGGLLGSMGAGAIAGAFVLPKVRQRVVVDRLVAGATAVFAVVTLALASLRELWGLWVVMFAGGVAWIALMSSFNVAAQAAVPPWVRARGLAVYLLVFQGGMAAGSVLWGAVAARLGIPVALIAAGAGLLLGLLAAKRYRLVSGEALDLTPSLHWPQPTVIVEPSAEHGPVLVVVEYHIDPAQAADFARAMQEVRLERLRDGAMRWDLFQDPADPQRYVETVMVESWVEHLRQHERVTLADRGAEARARALHIGPTPPTVSHLIAVRAAETTTARADH
jgi:MFS family permease/quinol monooxygenase YgiN